MPYNARREISSLFDPLVYLMLMSHWELCEILDFQRGTEMQLRSSEDFSRVRTKLANSYHTPSRTPNDGICVLPWHPIPLPTEHTPSPPNGEIDHPRWSWGWLLWMPRRRLGGTNATMGRWQPPLSRSVYSGSLISVVYLCVGLRC